MRLRIQASILIGLITMGGRGFADCGGASEALEIYADRVYKHYEAMADFNSNMSWGLSDFQSKYADLTGQTVLVGEDYFADLNARSGEVRLASELVADNVQVVMADGGKVRDLLMQCECKKPLAKLEELNGKVQSYGSGISRDIAKLGTQLMELHSALRVYETQEHSYEDADFAVLTEAVGAAELLMGLSYDQMSELSEASDQLKGEVSNCL